MDNAKAYMAKSNRSAEIPAMAPKAASSITMGSTSMLSPQAVVKVAMMVQYEIIRNRTIILHVKGMAP